MDAQVLAYNIAVFITAMFLLDFGADKFIDHTAIVASKLGVSQTLVALLTAGAEWEELAVVIAAVVQNHPSLALGNIMGSVISNILAAFSLGLMFQRGHTKFDKSSKIYVTLLLVITPPISVLAYLGKGGVVFGSILIAIFALYVLSIGFAISRGKISAPEPEDSDSDSDSDSDAGHGGDGDRNGGEPSSQAAIALEGCDETNPNEQDAPAAGNTSQPPRSSAPAARAPRKLGKNVFHLILGFLALSLSGYVLSHSATTIASQLGVSGTVYGITILAFATTLPEKFVAVISSRRGHSGIVVANTVGSNIFLLTLCLGVVFVSGKDAGVISPFELGFVLASVVALAVIIFIGSWRLTGYLLAVGYVAFFVLEFTVFRR